MKKHLTLLTLGVASLVSAQNLDPEIRAFMNSPAFAMSIAASYGVDSEVSPKPESVDIQAITAIQPLLQSGNMQQLEAAAQSLQQHITTQRAAGTKFSEPFINQVIGTLYFQISTMASGARATQYQQMAKDALEKAIDPNGGFPNYRQAHKNLARIYFQQDNLVKASESFVRAIQLGDKEPSNYVLLSKLYFDQSKYVAAESAARQAILLDPKIKESRTLLAYSLFQQERFAEARAVFEEMLQEDPNKADQWLMISNTLISTGDIDKAAQILEMVRLMGKAETNSLLLLGDVYMNKNMIEDAAQAYVEALDLAKKGGLTQSISTFIRPVETLNNFQAFELAMDLLDKTETTYAEKLDDAERNDILALRSEINIAQGRGEEAAKNLEQILMTDPMNRRALLSLGQYFARLQASGTGTEMAQKEERQLNVQRALDYFGRAQALVRTGNPEDEEAARQAFIAQGQLLAAERELESALAALQSAQNIRSEPRIAQYISMIAGVLESRRR